MRGGVVLLMLAMALTPVGDGLAKVLSAQASPIAVTFLKLGVAGLAGLVAAGLSGRKIVIAPTHRVGLAARTVLFATALTLLTLALSMTDLAVAVAGFLIAPVASVLFALLWLDERATRARALGITLAAAGAVAIARPGAGIDAGTLVAMAGGLVLGLFLMLQRRAGNAVDPTSTLVVQCLGGAALLLPMVILDVPVASATLLLGGMALGTVTAAIHFLTIAAYLRAEATALAPILYFNLLAALIVGLAVFGEFPPGPSLLGFLAIAAGGILAASGGGGTISAKIE